MGQDRDEGLQSPILGERAALGFRDGGGARRFDGPRLRTDSGLELRAFGPGDGSVYEHEKETRCYGDHWDDMTIGRYLRALMFGPEDEAEERALSEGSNPGGGHTVPSPLAAQVVDRLRERSILALAGVRFVNLPQGDSWKVATLESDPGFQWLAEGTTSSSTDPTFGAFTFDPHTFRGVLRASRELVQDALGFEQALERSIMGAMDVEVQRSVFNGSTGANQPKGIANTTEINAAVFGTTGGTAPSSTGAGGWSDIIQARRRLAEDNVQMGSVFGSRGSVRQAGRISAVWHPRTEAQFGSLRTASDKVWLPRPPVLDDVRFISTPAMPSTLSYGSTSLSGLSEIQMGDFSDCWVGFRLDPTIQVLQERFGGSYEIGWLAALRADVRFARFDSFERITRISS